MQIAFGLYPGFTALDAIGPYQVLTNLPGAEVVLCAERRGPLEYDPQPPFDAGSPSKAPAPIYEAVSALMAAAEAEMLSGSS